jgi:hypothetical protein
MPSTITTALGSTQVVFLASHMGRKNRRTAAGWLVAPQSLDVAGQEFEVNCIGMVEVLL